METTLKKVLESKAKIRFQDCDPFNHLNNASYLNYMINAREDQLIKYYEVDIYNMAQEQGVSWVTGSNQIAYLKPALLMEEVVIQTQLIKYSNKHLQVEMRMYNADKSQLKAIMWSSFVHFNFTRNSVQNHTEEFMQLFKNVCLPVNATNFEERVATIKKPAS
jgi:acyl-CoA thioester hydrolase